MSVRKVTIVQSAVVLMVALFVTIIAIVAKNEKGNHIQLHLETASSQFTREASTAILNAAESLRTVSSLISLLHPVSKKQFDKITDQYIGKDAPLLIIEWQPVVRSQDRDDFIQEARRLGQPNFDIWEPNVNDIAIPARQRTEHVPVLYMASSNDAADTSGLDLAWSAERMDSKLRARDTGSAQLSGIFPVVTNRDSTFNPIGYAITLPVYDKGIVPKSIEDKRNKLLGYVAGVYSIEKVLEPILSELNTIGFNVEIKNPGSPIPDYKSIAGESSSFSREVVQTIFTTEWSFKLIETEDHLSLHEQNIWYAIYAVVLAFGGVVLFFIKSLDSKTTALEKSEALFRNFFEKAPLPYQSLDEKGRFLLANEAWCRTLGYEPNEVVGKSFGSLLTESSKERFHNNFPRFKNAGEVHHVQFEMVRKDKSIILVEFEGKIGTDDNGQFQQTHCLLADITEREQSRNRIRLLSQAIEQSPVSVVITDQRGSIEYVNRSFERHTGYTFDEVKGQNPRILQSGKTTSDIYQDLWNRLTDGESWEGEFQNKKKSGELFWERAYIAPVTNMKGETEHYIGIKEDITLHKQQEEQIVFQAHYDGLTQLPNRLLSLDRLTHLIEEATRSKDMVAVLFLDLDDLKKINDTMGHETGDLVLIESAKRLLADHRGSDTVGRLGGDEFVVLLGNLNSPADAQSIAASIIDRFRQSFDITDRQFLLTASVGISLFPLDGDNPSELLRKADTAMYHAKKQGRNTYSFFTKEMNDELIHRVAMEEHIHGALDRNEFSVVYQPIVNLDDNTIVGAEALLRWTNPALGNVAPSDFIPIAEHSGLIVPLGQYVMEIAFKELKPLTTDNPDFRIAINLSPRQFRDPDLVSNIQKAVIDNEILPHQVEFEITEGVLMSGHDHLSIALAELSESGISIAMDDFGTGYSSLSHLRQYPFKKLKIDQSFIRDIALDSDDRELIIATISMSNGLNLDVVAEGVETEAQREFLIQNNCKLAQGFLFGKPCSYEEFYSRMNFQ
ncbi:MAG: EAL domain-containing protein [Candidatus Thiodiazotropha taylori]|nr:EAL domain-containing protein [Candidatus Thiodiazotropha taylori]